MAAFASVAGRKYKWLPVENKSHMADEAFVENFVRLGAVVNTTMRLADHTCPRSWILEFGHFGESSRQPRRIAARRSRRTSSCTRRTHAIASGARTPDSF